MKKKLSVRELKRYCEEHKPHCIYFKTENQAWYRTSDPCKLDMAFSIMLICENPNLICLKSSGNTLSFDRVKSIEVDTDASIPVSYTHLNKRRGFRPRLISRFSYRANGQNGKEMAQQNRGAQTFSVN